MAGLVCFLVVEAESCSFAHQAPCAAKRNQWRDRHRLPGEGRIGNFAPPLDGAGNSVKGQLVAKFLSQRLGMDLFVSEPEK